MGLGLIRTTATLTNGQTYAPNALLSDFFVLTMPTGLVNIAPATNVGVGQIIAIKVIYPPSGACRVIWDDAYQSLGSYKDQTWSGGTNTFGLFYEGNAYQSVWVGNT